MIFENILLTILDFAGFSQFSIPLTFINGFIHVIRYLSLLNSVFPVSTALTTALLCIRFAIVCGILKIVLRKIF